MRIRISKVRVTDHRPPGAGAKSPLERQGATRGGSLPARPAMTGLDHLAANRAAEQQSHDKWVAGLSCETLEAAWEDIKDRPCRDMKDPEQRWVANRKAALLRAGQRMRGAA